MSKYPIKRLTKDLDEVIEDYYKDLQHRIGFPIKKSVAMNDLARKIKKLKGAKLIVK